MCFSCKYDQILFDENVSLTKIKFDLFDSWRPTTAIILNKRNTLKMYAQLQANE